MLSSASYMLPKSFFIVVLEGSGIAFKGFEVVLQVLEDDVVALKCIINGFEFIIIALLGFIVVLEDFVVVLEDGVVALESCNVRLEVVFEGY